MNWSTLDLLQSIGIVFTLAATIIQMRLYLKGERISIVTRISERNDALLNDLIRNAQAVKGFDKPFKPARGGYFADARVSIMYRILNFFDEMSYYRGQGYISENTWSLYENTVKRFLDNQFAQTFWKHVRDEYSRSFQAFIDQTISRLAPG